MKVGTQKVSVAQQVSEIESFNAYLRKTAPFEEWRKKLGVSDQLPRGKFFRGKKPGRSVVLKDEFWRAGSSTVFDVSQFEPFGVVAFCHEPAVRVTAESLARFRIAEGAVDASRARPSLLPSTEGQAPSPEQ